MEANFNGEVTYSRDSSLGFYVSHNDIEGVRKWVSVASLSGAVITERGLCVQGGGEDIVQVVRNNLIKGSTFIREVKGYIYICIYVYI